MTHGRKLQRRHTSQKERMEKTNRWDGIPFPRPAACLVGQMGYHRRNPRGDGSMSMDGMRGLK